MTSISIVSHKNLNIFVLSICTFCHLNAPKTPGYFALFVTYSSFTVALFVTWNRREQLKSSHHMSHEKICHSYTVLHHLSHEGRLLAPHGCTVCHLKRRQAMLVVALYVTWKEKNGDSFSHYLSRQTPLTTLYYCTICHRKACWRQSLLHYLSLILLS